MLEGHGTLGVLADQHAGNKGCWVEFFGRPASTNKAIAVFALSNDAAVMVGYARRLGRPLHYEMAMEAHGRAANHGSGTARRDGADAMVHARAGNHRAPCAGAILVGSPAVAWKFGKPKRRRPAASEAA